MATSGNTSFNLTAANIIQEALELLGIVSPTEVTDGADYASCLRSLNMMVKSWQQKGIFVTHEAEATIFITPGQMKYILGGSNPSRTAQEPVIEILTSDDYAATDTAIEVTSTTGMTALDVIGIMCDDGTIHWTTIASVDDATNLTLTVALPSGSSSGSYVFSYTDVMGRPLEIEHVAIRRTGGTDLTLSSGLQDQKIHMINRDKYLNTYNKGQAGTPVYFHFNQQNTYSELFVWPTGSREDERFKITYKRVIEDFTNSADTADLPQNWTACLAYNLAAYVAPKYGKEQKAAAAIAPIASQLLKDAMADVQDKSSFKILPRVFDNNGR